MSDLDNEQNRRIRDVETRINELENQVSMLLGKLETTTSLLKVVAIGLGAVVGLYVLGMMI